MSRAGNWDVGGHCDGRRVDFLGAVDLGMGTASQHGPCPATRYQTSVIALAGYVAPGQHRRPHKHNKCGTQEAGVWHVALFAMVRSLS